MLHAGLLLFAIPLVASQAPQQLTGCQQCCSPGGDCSKASHGNEGVCCGQVNGVGPGYCCPTDAKCVPCATSYRCYRGIRPPPSVCANDGGRPGFGADETVSSLVGLLSMLLLCFALYTCMRGRRTALAHSDSALAPVPVGGIQLGTPLPPGHAAAMPVAAAQPCGMQPYPQPYVPPYPQHYGHPYPPAYGGGYGGGGYGGGTVAMGAGMGFLGGMMMGEALADAGHHGGDYGGGYGGGDDFGGGGGGDFAADM